MITALTVIGNDIFAGVYNQGIWKRHLSEVVGIDDNIVDNIISIFPNPMSHSSTINIHNIPKNAEITIYDIFGKLLFCNHINDSSIEIEKDSLIPGIYFIKICSNGKRITKKIIVQ